MSKLFRVIVICMHGLVDHIVEHRIKLKSTSSQLGLIDLVIICGCGMFGLIVGLLWHVCVWFRSIWYQSQIRRQGCLDGAAEKWCRLVNIDKPIGSMLLFKGKELTMNIFRQPLLLTQATPSHFSSMRLCCQAQG